MLPKNAIDIDSEICITKQDQIIEQYLKDS